jgi:hypothetical protein
MRTVRLLKELHHQEPTVLAHGGGAVAEDCAAAVVIPVVEHILEQVDVRDDTNPREEVTFYELHPPLQPAVGQEVRGAPERARSVHEHAAQSRVVN